MNLEAQPWIADFCFSAALGFVFLAVSLDFGGCLLLFDVFRVLGSGFSAWCVPDLFFLGRGRDEFWVFCPADPPAQCRGWSKESGHSIVAQDTWSGFRWFLAYPVLLFFSSCRPPPGSGAGDDLDKNYNAHWGTGPPRFLC